MLPLVVHQEMMRLRLHVMRVQALALKANGVEVENGPDDLLEQVAKDFEENATSIERYNEAMMTVRQEPLVMDRDEAGDHRKPG